MATQKGRNWSSGDIVTAANLSSIERGVSAVAEEYTPTTWTNGNTVTAAGLNNIEQGLVNAGGGLSDFSTATVTIVNNNAQYDCTAQGAFAFDEFGHEPVLENLSASYCFIDPNSTKVLNLILYKGKGNMNVNASGTSITGNIEYVDEQAWDNDFVVTGDGTITIS